LNAGLELFGHGHGHLATLYMGGGGLMNLRGLSESSRKEQG
jgi:hypothetical protein